MARHFSSSAGWAPYMSPSMIRTPNPDSPRRRQHTSAATSVAAPLSTFMSPKLHSPKSIYRPSSTSRPSNLKEVLTMETADEARRSSFVSNTSVVILQPRADTPGDDRTHPHSHSPLVLTAWTVLTSVSLGAIFLVVLVYGRSTGILFLGSFLTSVLNYEMAWYSYAIIQKLLRPFQLYYEMDVLAPYRDTSTASTVAESWSARAGIPALAMSLVVSVLVTLLTAGLVSILQLYGNLGLGASWFFVVLAFLASSTFVAVFCAINTPTPMDAAVLLLQQLGYAVPALNMFLDYRESVDGHVRQIILVDPGFAMGIVFVLIAICRIVRSTEVARTGLTLLLDLFSLEYVTSMLMLLARMTYDMLTPDPLYAEIVPNHHLYAIVLCFLTFWATDLTAALLAKRASRGLIVSAGAAASIVANVVLKYAVAPTDVPLLQWYHFVFMVLGSCLYHIGATFVSLLRFLARDDASVVRSQWLVWLQYFLLLGYFLMLFERIEFAPNYNTTIQDQLDQVTRQWQRMDNTSYNAYQASATQYQFVQLITQVIGAVHKSYTPAQMHQMFVVNTHHMVLNLGACVVNSVQGNVTGKQCFAMYQ
ncbi:Aste57867_15797 [Aphanomyces stellatus]|uniref:Aste57867_15797 protein n=1 Tax=Aphanomyces stellatus TaxID=120398 RepID=A0A485L4I5_9STRA|nr:hypothetical protein As57867_015741 [Aphanomyces stellatus]VFT92585.1 Aste57867_15797 [Aphanomyces stellatus]